jgi:hypothetical protein
MAREIRRVNSRSYQRTLRYTAEDGNAVRVPEWREPEKHGNRRGNPKQKTPRDPKKNGGNKNKKKKQEKFVTPHVRRSLAANRERETRIGVQYVAFLSVVCIITLFLCIHYLQLRSRVTTQSVKIATLESELTSLTQDNDAYYKDVLTSVTIDDVREAALGRLGMHYPSEEEIRYYSTQDGSYVRQYQDVS